MKNTKLMTSLSLRMAELGAARAIYVSFVSS